mmetsp:Transcript_32500/g.58806  ORF Transcript_32500/g.58806 Transcript_32500/m.58806 type:complete len:102 (+) Transcript_32500:1305-1610(+)
MSCSIPFQDDVLLVQEGWILRNQLPNQSRLIPAGVARVRLRLVPPAQVHPFRKMEALNASNETLRKETYNATCIINVKGKKTFSFLKTNAYSDYTNALYLQ